MTRLHTEVFLTTPIPLALFGADGPAVDHVLDRRNTATLPEYLFSVLCLQTVKPKGLAEPLKCSWMVRLVSFGS